MKDLILRIERFETDLIRAAGSFTLCVLIFFGKE